MSNIDWNILLIRKFPNFNNDWDNETKIQWFDGFRGVWDIMKRYNQCTIKTKYSIEAIVGMLPK